MFATALALALLCSSKPASAERARTADNLSFSGGLRYATDDLDLGVGARIGYTLDIAIYAGAAFDYFFGTTDFRTLNGLEHQVQAQYWQIGPEVGYDIGITKSSIIRPFVGFGFGSVSATLCTLPRDGFSGSRCMETQRGDRVFSLGFVFDYVFSNGLFMGGHGRGMFADEQVFDVGVQFGAVL